MTHPDHSQLSCSNYGHFFESVAVVDKCDRLANGALRLKTVFQYPNGSWIDIFVDKTEDIFQQFRLSDYGASAEYLRQLGLDPLGTKKRKVTLNRICETLGVSFEDDELQIILKEEEIRHGSKYLVRLAQACLRMSDLQLTKRFRTFNSFREEFEEALLADREGYETDYEIGGAYSNVVRIDFRVKGQRSDNLLQTLSTGNAATAHALATDTFAKWHDIRRYSDQYSFFSIYDSRNNAFKAEDIQRLSEVSTVLGFPDQAEAIEEALAA